MKGLLYWFLTIALLLLCACEKEEEPQVPLVAGRTVLVYFAADNNLSGSVEGDIAAMEDGLLHTDMHNGNLLVYVDKKGQSPQLLRLVQEGDSICRELIEEYAIDHASATAERLRQVLRQVTDSYPSDRYGLVLWSHGTAWLPADYKNYLRSFGTDTGNHFMSVNDLTAALSDYHFDFLLFDACYMASLEVAYALRHCTDYLIASPTEVLADGFPYQLFMQDLFTPEANVVDIATQFYTYYQSSYGTVSVTKTAELADLATAYRVIFQGKSEEELFAVPVQELQIMEYLTGNIHALYDCADYVRQLATDAQYEEFQSCLDRAVIYKATTPKSAYAYANGTYLPINRFSGLSIYVPQAELAELNNWYQQLEWYQAVYQ
ncbi:clostripain [Parabacteroides distasonis]|nr:clostripain [Parabacteroides distasonis]